ncbi:uncharacterized protein [Typha angustifolia]|uniref:uncharacterized protein n=1 Tax=Typha angustifolia TaxID=59011 RepID=UPI003C2C6471
MGIIKIRPRGPGTNNQAGESTHIHRFDELAQDDTLLRGDSFGYDSDNCELAELGCEHIMFGGQLCNVPYDLYELPDLKEILSLETWNFCLTEEERFFLTAYLPDMDRQTFCLTVKELLNGDILYFGSPLGIFFHRMKGGFYSPEVTQSREALLFLQRRGYYHSLESYHENMVRKFANMKRPWNNCQSNISSEGNGSIWNNRRFEKPVILVDLNAFPTEEDIPNKVNEKVATAPLLKKTKYLDSMVKTDDSMGVLGARAAKAKNKAKGVLKIKPVEMNSLNNHDLLSFPNESWELCKRLPKGVLKIKSKGDSLGVERARMMHTPPEQTTADLLSIHTPRFSIPQFASLWDEQDFGENSPYVIQTDRDINTYATPHLDVQQRVKFPKAGSGILKSSQNIHRKIKSREELRMYHSEATTTGEFPYQMNLQPNPCKPGSLLYESSASSYIRTHETHQDQRQMTLVCPTVPKAVSKIPTFCGNTYPSFTKFPDQSDLRNRDPSNALKVPSVHMAVSQDVREGSMFPITYKRRKAYRKLNPADSRVQTSVVANLESTTLPTSAPSMKTKVIKIKFKGWSS